MTRQTIKYEEQSMLLGDALNNLCEKCLLALGRLLSPYSCNYTLIEHLLQRRNEYRLKNTPYAHANIISVDSAIVAALIKCSDEHDPKL